jgi:hypothetical protein
MGVTVLIVSSQSEIHVETATRMSVLLSLFLFFVLKRVKVENPSTPVELMAYRSPIYTDDGQCHCGQRRGD